MKIEKVNENQIRCTLTREDLASRQLKVSELAYGTEKAKNLFRDMMKQANFEFGFEAEDIPLMIEAIPLNSECIVLIITKVEDPEELDTRFARFSPSVTEELDDAHEHPEDATDEIFDMFRHLQNAQGEAPAADSTKSDATSAEKERTRIFLFRNLSQVFEAASVIAGSYTGDSALYKDAGRNQYLLVLKQGTGSAEIFDRTCNIVSEYGSVQRASTGSSAFLAEHCEALISENAVQSLGQA